MPKHRATPPVIVLTPQELRQRQRREARRFQEHPKYMAAVVAFWVPWIFAFAWIAAGQGVMSGAVLTAWLVSVIAVPALAYCAARLLGKDWD